MKSNLYVVFDKDLNSAGPVFNAVNNRIAWRNFRSMVEKEGLQESYYELYCIGEYDPDTMKIIPASVPEVVTYE